MTNNVYPSTEELMPDMLLGRIPSALEREIRERYATLGEKYLTDELTGDGRRVNNCMNKNSIQDCREEVVDAVFNTLVWIFKHRISDEGKIPDSAYGVFVGLIDIYGILLVEKERDAVA